MDEINEVVQALISLQKRYTESWLRDIAHEKKFNLKRKNLSDLILTDPETKEILSSEFMDLVKATIANLNEELGEMIKPYRSLHLWHRIKNPASLEDKLKRYFFVNKEHGRVKVIKCINDLAGFRKILPHETYMELHDKMTAEGPAVLSHIDPSVSIRCVPGGSKGSDYEAVHVYIQCDSFAFPWEIQFWDSADKKNNLALHSEYKQSYVKEIEAAGDFNNPKGGSNNGRND